MRHIAPTMKTRLILLSPKVNSLKTQPPPRLCVLISSQQRASPLTSNNLLPTDGNVNKETKKKQNKQNKEKNNSHETLQQCNIFASLLPDPSGAPCSFMPPTPREMLPAFAALSSLLSSRFELACPQTNPPSFLPPSPPFPRHLVHVTVGWLRRGQAHDSLIAL